MAVVDDVMSAGSSLRATFEELRAHGAETVAAGALLVLGRRGSDFFDAHSVRGRVGRARQVRDLGAAGCPLCAASVPLEDPAPAGMR